MTHGRSFAIAGLVWLMSGAFLTLGCGSPAAPSAGGMGPVAMRPCPTSGPGGVTSAGACWVFPPASAGASPLGQNASRPNYALEPPSARGTLVVLLNGSGSSPSQL